MLRDDHRARNAVIVVLKDAIEALYPVKMVAKLIIVDASGYKVYPP